MKPTNLVANRRQANDFLAVFFSIFELGSTKKKHFIFRPAGHNEFCFPWSKSLSVYCSLFSLRSETRTVKYQE